MKELFLENKLGTIDVKLKREFEDITYKGKEYTRTHYSIQLNNEYKINELSDNHLIELRDQINEMIGK